MKILIAEDDPMLQTMAGNIMNHWGFDFDTLGNAAETGVRPIILEEKRWIRGMTE